MADWDQWVASDEPAVAASPEKRKVPAPDSAMGFSSAQPAPPAKSTGAAALPPEADALYRRVRKAEGTADGGGFVFYGGQPFTPGKEFPEWEGLPGPKGRTHAAGPGQWQPDTWNGLKPDFEKRFGRAPEFSSDADQKAMTWLNAAKIYPGGEAKMRRDLAENKLDTAALAPQWAGFGGGGSASPWAVTGSDKWRVSDRALAAE